MRIRLNGDPLELPDRATLAEAAARAGADPGTRGLAAAVDGEVVPRAEWERTELADGQTVEVVRAIQGGAP
jgi:sulfur carrier protein